MLVLTGQRDEARAMFQRGLDALGERDAITRARLNRLMANTWTLNRHKIEAERFLNAAQRALGEASSERENVWWDEFIEIGLERLWFMYWFFEQENRMRELVEHLEPSINRSGTPTQRSKYYRSRALYELSCCHWFHPEDHVLLLAEQAVAAARQGATLFELCFAMFGRGFVYLWRDDLDVALAQFMDMLAIAERCGDSERVVLGVNYIALTYRRLHRVAETQDFAERTMILAKSANMPVYIGQAKGNLAWVDLQRGEYISAEQKAREGLGLLAPPIPVSWTVTLPLVAALHQRRETTEAVDLLEKTLAGLQRLAPPVEAAIQVVITANKAQGLHAVYEGIDAVLTVAKRYAYL